MKRIILPIVIILLTLSSCSYTTMVGGGETVIKNYDYSDFEKVSVSSGMKVNIIQSDSYSIEVKGGDRTLEYLAVDVEGDKLKFYYTERSLVSKGEVMITINMPKLTGLSLSGGSRGKIDMENEDEHFLLNLSGGSAFKGSLKCQNIKVNLSGGSSSQISGNGKNLFLNSSGGSIFNLKEFVVKEAEIELSGGSNGSVNIEGTLNTSQSGGSHLQYYGTPNLGNTSFSGGSGLSKGK
ncbi:MAG: DUF2807 domain-containing protein [Ignavibacteriaceae bacterium]|nr:DUF2807 domain-containing protein [Ignavibacteriaceae bacterium]